MTALTERVFPDPERLGAALAREIADGLVAAGAAGRQYLLGCPGGRSPRSTYRALARIVTAERIDLTPLVIAMMDDYVEPAGSGYRPVSPRRHYSLRRLAADDVVLPLNAAAGPGRGVTDDRLWFPDPGDPAGYDARLAEPGVDLFILASGDSDGHVAFNPPGTPLDARTRVTALADSTRRDNLGTFPGFRSIDQVPRHGLGVGTATIRDAARRAVLVAPGRGKREAVARLRRATGYDPDWPATVLLECRDPALYLDAAADAPAHPPHPMSERSQHA
jgi:glucosamine-6-phosphate deaminase